MRRKNKLRNTNLREDGKQRHFGWAHARLNATSGYEMKYDNLNNVKHVNPNKPIDVEITSPAKWNKETLKLKRTYNRIIGKKFWDENRGTLLIKIDMNDIFGRKESKRVKS